MTNKTTTNNNATDKEFVAGQTRKPALPIHYDDFKDILAVDPSSPSGLRWLNVETVRSCYRGNPAGYLDSKGYYCIKVRSCLYKAHRVVFCLAHQVPSLDTQLVIDHIDGDRANNSIENLRLVTAYENSRNKRGNLQGDKASPFPYVRWNSAKSKWESRYPAAMTVDGKQKYIGLFTDPLIAFMVLFGELRARGTLPNSAMLSVVQCFTPADGDAGIDAILFDLEGRP